MRHLLTEAGERLPSVPWEDYPRPQLKRDSWQCLNGLWNFGTDPSRKETILVPFCPESLLSGIRREFPAGTTFYYRRRFKKEIKTENRKIFLHFGASDQITKVSLNGTFLGEHRGGYLPFSFDITDLLREENVLEAEIVDDLSHELPWGKQKRDRGGMWYTPVSGIWQTVWLESVPAVHVAGLKIENGPEAAVIRVSLAGGTAKIRLTLREEAEVSETEPGCFTVRPKTPRFWSPDDPFLYRFTVEAGEDRAESYFALREIAVRTVGGKKRLCLNGEPFFFHALLDQGYFSDGIYTPAVPGEYERDIRRMKALGFNTLRKHIKIEPERFYFDCDRLGMVVMQDMVNTGEFSFAKDGILPNLGVISLPDRKTARTAKAAEAFLAHMEETVRHLGNHPSILYWTIFNEGWGQVEADGAYERLKELDPGRIVDSTSGWFHRKRTDVDSRHIYFRKLKLGKEDRPQMLSEFGGYVWKVPEHSANTEKTYGYRILPDWESFLAAFRKLYEEEVLPLAERGLCGAVYTQLSDVEDETNGLLTYDRRVEKIRPEEFADLAEKLQAAVRR